MAIKELLARFGTMAAFTAVVLAIGAAPASAATSEAVVYTGGTAAGKAWFNSGSGENYWYVKDDKCDGKSVNLHYYVGNSGWYSAQVSSGCGTGKRAYPPSKPAGSIVRYYLTLTTSWAKSSTVTDFIG